LNQQFLAEDCPTDVLAFDLSSDGSSYRRGRGRVKVIDGEIIISATTAVRNARTFKTTPVGEIRLYVIHGILHLLGYDDHVPADIKMMRAQEAKLVTLLSSSRRTNRHRTS